MKRKLSNEIIGIAIEIHRSLGPGLLESAYKECLFCALNSRGFLVEKEFPVPLIFEGRNIGCAHRIDLLVESKVVVEIKSIEALNDIHLAQTLTYLRLGKFPLGLLITFSSTLLKDGIRQIVNGKMGELL